MNACSYRFVATAWSRLVEQSVLGGALDTTNSFDPVPWLGPWLLT